MLEDNILRFFLGANTPGGFVSRFAELADVDAGWRKLVIKGGPGCGKSTMMEKIVDTYKDSEPDMQIIPCASDADSIDAVILPGRKVSIADGTLPHAIELRYPGAYESLIDMTSCCNEDALFAHREEIVRLSKSCTRCHEYCCRYLSAAASLAADTHRIGSDCVNTAKLSGYLARLAEREFKPIKKEQGKESVRFLTAVTNKGVVRFTQSAKKMCDRIYLISDDMGAVSRLVLSGMRSNALAAGYDVVSCYCPLFPFEKLEQLFIPQLGLGFMTSNRYHDFAMEIDPYRIVNSQRFTDNEKLKSSKKRLSYNRKAQAQMVKQAELLMSDAKAIHDELEGYYHAVTDFSKVDALTEKVLGKICSKTT